MFITFPTNTKVGGFVNILKDGNQVQSGLEICVLETIHHHSSGLAESHSNTPPTEGRGPWLQTDKCALRALRQMCPERCALRIFLDAKGRLWCFLETHVLQCINGSMAWSDQGVIFPLAMLQTLIRILCSVFLFSFKGNMELCGEEREERPRLL